MGLKSYIIYTILTKFNMNYLLVRNIYIHKGVQNINNVFVNLYER